MKNFKKIKATARTLFSNITVEPLFLLFAICIGFYAIASSTLYIQKVCKVNLNISEEICDNIQKHEEEQNQVQEYVSKLKAYNDVIQAIPPCIFVLFAGPWSDRFGRKPVLFISLLGYALKNLIFFLNAYYFYELKAEWLLLEAVQEMTGGSTTLFMASYAYLTDITSPENRTTRFSLMDGLFYIGFYIGNGMSGPTTKYLGFLFNFFLGMVFDVLAMAYIVFFLPDSTVIREKRLQKQADDQIHELKLEKKFEEAEKVQKEDNERKDIENALKTSGYKDLFSLKNLKDGFVAVFCKAREHNGRVLLILLILAFELEMFSVKGMWSSSYLYLRKVLKFDEAIFSRYMTICGVINLLGKYIVVPFLSNRQKWSDSAIALTDSFTSVINLLCFAYAVEEWMLYIGGLIAILDSTTTTMMRSMISKMVDPGEVGMVFSIVGTFQAMIPFAAGPSFNMLYKRTVRTFPAAFIFVVIGIKTVVFVDVLIVYIKSRKVMKIKRQLEVQATSSLNEKTLDAQKEMEKKVTQGDEKQNGTIKNEV